VSACEPGNATAHPQERPAETAASELRGANLVLIILDTLRADVLGCYGSALETSREVDELARKGVVFERVIAQCSWTRPSIGSFLTSRYPRELGLYDEKDEILADSFETLAETLKKAGYSTIGITANPNINGAFGFGQGFDRHLDSTTVFPWMAIGGDSYRDKKLMSAKEAFQAALKYIDELSPPYYLELDVMEMHEHFQDDSHSLIRSEFRDLYPEQSDKAYFQSLRQLSVDVGDLVATLEMREEFANTLFVLVSDHGEGLGDHPDVLDSRLHGRLLYESNVSVPLILYAPSRPADWRSRVSNAVRLLDLKPTLLDLLSVPRNEEDRGVSLVPLMRGQKAPAELPELFVTETEFRDYQKIGAYGTEWKYFENHDQHKGLPRRELQKIGVKENGTLTDQRESQREESRRMRRFLREFEDRFQRRPPTLRSSSLTEGEIEQLEAIGYLKKNEPDRDE